MARHHNTRGEQRPVNKRRDHAREAERQMAEGQGTPLDRRGEVEAEIARLQGRSIRGLEPDDVRGAGSPLSQEKQRRRGR